MKYAKSILLSIAVGVVLDILIDVLIPNPAMNVVFVVTMSVVLLGILLVAFGTITKNRWGINLEPMNGPACGSPMPKVRRPESFRQALWVWWHLREVRLRNGQMGPSDYVKPLVVEISRHRTSNPNGAGL